VAGEEMKHRTFIRATLMARDDMERAMEIRQAGRQGIRSGKDRLARKWQKAERQHLAFRERAFDVAENNESELKFALIKIEQQYCKLEEAAIVLQNVFDDGEGGENRGDINNYLVGYNQHFLRK
jgi:hypothetical protein